ncbi:hypothetical protein Efla_006481 [Eimeria flavescens]
MTERGIVPGAFDGAPEEEDVLGITTSFGSEADAFKRSTSETSSPSLSPGLFGPLAHDASATASAHLLHGEFLSDMVSQQPDTFGAETGSSAPEGQMPSTAGASAGAVEHSAAEPPSTQVEPGFLMVKNALRFGDQNEASSPTNASRYTPVLQASTASARRVTHVE